MPRVVDDSSLIISEAVATARRWKGANASAWSILLTGAHKFAKNNIHEVSNLAQLSFCE
jgi:hypothetical protein